MSSSNLQLVQEIYAAIGREDIATVFGSLSPHIEIEQSTELPWGGSYRGLDQAKSFFGKVKGHLDSQVVQERFITSGDYILAIGRTKGTVLANGSSFDVPLVHVWQVRDGKVVSLHVHLENAVMLAALSSAKA